MNKVLVIAYYFPPLAGGGVQRSLKFVKYLRSFNWEPVVLTTSEDVKKKDEFLEKDIPEGVEVDRIDAFNMMKYYNLARKVKLSKFLSACNKLLGIPDDKIFWSLKSRKKAIELINKYKIKVIYTTSSPYSSHLLGLYLKKKLNIKWVADFRDPWVDNNHFTFIHKKLSVIMEKKVINNSDFIISVSEPIINSLKSKYDKEQYNKFGIITNGYDEDDIKSIKINNFEPNKKFTIIYTGSFYGYHSPLNFLKAIIFLERKGTINDKNFQAIFIGNFNEYEQSLRNHKLIKTIDYVPHDESLGKLLQSDSLLLVISPKLGRGIYTGKIFEYLAVNKPILALVPKDDVAADLIRKTNAGIICDPDSIEEIAEGLNKLINLFRQGELEEWRFNNEVIKYYSRKKLTEKLASIFDRMINDVKENNEKL